MSNKFLKYIFFIYTMLNFNNLFAKLEKLPTVLFIVLNDGVSIDDHVTGELTKFMELGFPEHEIVLAEIHVNRLGFFESYHRRRLISKLSQVIGSNNEITHLVISTHGNSNSKFLGLNKSNSSTDLGYIGSFDETEPDTNFRSVFDSIKDRFSRKLTIVLNSCSTMCGTETQKKNRARSLLNYFNADQGQVYGAYTAEISTYILEQHLITNKLKWSHFGPSLKQIQFTLPFLFLSTYLGTLYANAFLRLTTESFILDPTIMGLMAGSVATLGLSLIKLKSLWDILKDRKINLGSIFYFNGAGEIEVVNINKRLKNLAQIYNIPKACEFYLTQPQYSAFK